MATSSFLNRWSKRKLEQTSNYTDEVHHTDQLETVTEESESETAQNDVGELLSDTESVAAFEETKVEELSIANLLVSEASESVKKAALRNLFLSEEFNVRDGLDDYDDDYSNLKSLSEGVAETLRDWIKDKTEQEPTDEEQLTELQPDAEPEVVSMSESEQESAENLVDENKLYKNTVVVGCDTLESDTAAEPLGQNRPYSK